MSNCLVSSRLRASTLACIGALATALAVSGCGGPGRSPAGDEGALAAQLQVAPTLALTSASFSITGPASYMRAGTVDVSNSGTLSFNVGGIPAGSGYALSVSATASDGGTTCAGSASFSVTARATSAVMVNLLCREPARNGSIQVSGTVNICPVIDGISATPNEVLVGASLALSATAHDSNTGPSALTYLWTATGGTLSGAATASATFTCTAPGSSTVTLTVTDGDCSDVLTTSVTCSPGQATPPVVRINEVE